MDDLIGCILFGLATLLAVGFVKAVNFTPSPIDAMTTRYERPLMTNPTTPHPAAEKATPRLLPCPFCDSANLAAHEGTTFRWVVIQCNDCEASCGEVRAYNDYTLANPDAIAAWNTRAVSAAVDALVTAVNTLLPYLSTEAQLLDAASLNEGRASGFDMASVKVRAAIAEVERLKGEACSDTT